MQEFAAGEFEFDDPAHGESLERKLQSMLGAAQRAMAREKMFEGSYFCPEGGWTAQQEKDIDELLSDYVPKIQSHIFKAEDILGRGHDDSFGFEWTAA